MDISPQVDMLARVSNEITNEFWDIDPEATCVSVPWPTAEEREDLITRHMGRFSSFDGPLTVEMGNELTDINYHEAAEAVWRLLGV